MAVLFAVLIVTSLAVAAAQTQSEAAVASAASAGPWSVPGEWAWMAGSNLIKQPGVYPPLGQAGSAATPGARGYGAGWLGTDGRIWLFGGAGYDANGFRGDLNDLWAYDPTVREWAWMGGSSAVPCDVCGPVGVYGAKGVSDAGNVPGGREWMAYWLDRDGNFWLFGGLGFDAVGQEDPLNDLWEFDFKARQWTWWSGSDKTGPTGFQDGVYGTIGVPDPKNTPGSRGGSGYWVDADGNLWLYGGFGWTRDGGDGWLNDLWKFDMRLKQWAWMGGSPTSTQTSPFYGIQGQPGPANDPGGRQDPITWSDPKGHFWLFAGGGRDGLGDWRYYNDLWEYDPATAEWTWWNGDSNLPITDDFYAAPGVYGTKGVADPANQPGSRYFGTGTTDEAGNLWLFGGFGFGYDGNPGFLNDLWEYQVAKRQWVWISGTRRVDSNGGAPGAYGRRQVAAATNVPPGRGDHPIWMDASGQIWLFGGSDYQARSNFGDLNDLWLYTPDTTTPQTASPTFSPAAGTYTSAQNVTIADTTAGATIYYTTDGSTPSASSTVYSSPVAVAKTTTIKAIASASGYADSAVSAAVYTITLPAAAAPSFSPAPGAYTSAQTVTLSDSTAGATIYYTTDGSTPTASSTVSSSPIAVAKTTTIKAFASASGYSDSVVSSGTYTITLPAAANPTFTPAAGTYTSVQNVTLADTTPGAVIYYTTDGTTLPTTASPVYASPIAVNASMTIQALAVASGYSPSAVESATYTIQLPNPDFVVAVAPASLTIKAGQSGTATVDINPANGFAAAVSLTCSGLPKDSTCSFSPSTVNPAGGSAASSTVTIQTASDTLVAQGRGTAIFGVLALTLFGLGWRRMRHFTAGYWVTLLVAATMLGSLCGCANYALSPTQHPPITAQVTITATSGNTQHSTTVTVTVD